MPSYNISTSVQTSSAFSGILYDDGGSGGNYATSKKLDFLIEPKSGKAGWMAKNLSVTIHEFDMEKSTDDMDGHGGTIPDYVIIRSTPALGSSFDEAGAYWKFFRESSNIFAVQRVVGGSAVTTVTGTLPYTITDNMLDYHGSPGLSAKARIEHISDSSAVGAGWKISWSADDFYTGSFFNTDKDPGVTKYNAGVIPLDASGTKGADGIIVELNKFAQHNYDKSTPQAPFSFMHPGPFTLRQRTQAYAPNKGTKLEKVFKERR